MSIPRKGSRKINANGRDFIYIVKERNIADHPDQKEIVVTVQENVERPGRVMQFNAPYGVEVTPSNVIEKISIALSKGWKPSERGSAFNLFS